MTASRSGPVERAARRDLRRLAAEVRTSALAEAVLQLAQRLDGRHTCGECAEAHPAIDAKEETALVRELRTSMAALRDVSPARAEGDVVDELRARRASRAADR